MAEKKEKELRADLLAALFVFYVKNSIRNDGCSEKDGDRFLFQIS
jgi:hypothetical protein